QETRYPWDGAVTLRVELARPAQFGLRLRLPSWCPSPRIAVNGAAIDPAGAERGYVRIERMWRDGDQVTPALPLPIEQVFAHPNIAADVGSVALQRGPLVYCFEQTDHVAPLHRIVLPDRPDLTDHFEPDLLGGVVAIAGSAVALDDAGWDDALYRTSRPPAPPTAVKAISFFPRDTPAPCPRPVLGSS